MRYKRQQQIMSYVDLHNGTTSSKRLKRSQENRTPNIIQPSSINSVDNVPDDLEIDTGSVANQVTSWLRNHNISQETFARLVLQRAQGTLSDLLNHPKPWDTLKNGKATFYRMWRWLHLDEKARLAQLQMDKSPPDSPPSEKKHRPHLTDLQRTTLRRIFNVCPRPSKYIVNMIAEQMGLTEATVANFFMNARRRCHQPTFHKCISFDDALQT